MAMDLDEAVGKGRESLPGGSSSALSLGPGKGGTAIRGIFADNHSFLLFVIFFVIKIIN